ncbi:DUF6538 domain-containing protein [Marivita sp.]|uniref:DUF6538 domain-containing protein n=1 Tax=Marivita sp. TaxID=2003365 RepID=UPI003F6AB575
MNKSTPYTFKKSGIFYFIRRIPKHVRHRYRTDKISFSLRTRSASIACQKAQRLAETLDQHWFAMQISEDVTFSRYLTVGRAIAFDLRSGQAVENAT